ncbi:MAG: fused MFS/spermidine synthase [Planctomycetes bacterium]|nr:fused MFS/spermidine synthase [Planctomycetota bacterium]
MRRGGGGALLALFLFVSGATALVYEVVWMRILVTHLGSTAYAVAAILAGFMAGMGAGYELFGRLADRLRQRGSAVSLYGLLEIGIGLYALLFPFLARWVVGTPMGLGLRLAAGLALVFLPTVAMGGTLPLLAAARAAARPAAAGSVAGSLYGANTVGAAVGVLAGAFLLLPGMGAWGALFLCAGAGVAVGSAALAAGRRWERLAPAEEGPARTRPEPGGAAPRQTTHLYLVCFLTGLVALAFEVLWTRMLVMAIGGTVHAFAIILAVVLAGTGAGGLVAGRWAPALGSEGVLGILLAALAAALGASALTLGKANAIFVGLAGGFSSYGDILWSQLALSLLVMFLPAVFFGMVPPLAAGMVASRTARVGRGVGKLFAVNAAGAVAGGLVATFALVPGVGIRHSVLLLSLAVGVAGAALLVRVRPLALDFARGALLLGLAAPPLFFFAAGPWDPRQVAFGAGYRPEFLADPDQLARFDEIVAAPKLRFYRDGVTATVSVVEYGGVSYLAVGGKGMASDGEEARDHYLLAHLPLLVHPAPRRVLSIGLGMGATLEATLAHDVESVTVVEIEPAVVEACRTAFSHVGGKALGDPRVELVLDDARHYLVANPEAYDVVVCQPFHPWVSGANNLYTVEFLELVRDRLEEGGVFCLGFIHPGVATSDVRTMVRTFRQVFPAASVWKPREGGDLYMVGVMGEYFAIDGPGFLARSAAPKVAAHLEERAGIASGHALLANLLFGPAGAESFGAGGPVNRDMDPVLEFETARSLFSVKAPREALPFLLAAKEPAARHVLGLSPEEAEALLRHERVEGLIDRLGQMDGPEAEVEEEVYEQAWRLAPDDPWLQLRLAKVLGRRANRQLAAGDVDLAKATFEKAIEARPDFRPVHFQLGSLLYQQGQVEAAMPHLEASGVHEDFAPALLWRGRHYASLGQFDRARHVLAEYIRLRPGDPLGHNALGIVLAELGAPAEAERAFQAALSADPRFHEALTNLGHLYLREGRRSDAMSAFHRSLALYPDQPAVRKLVAP